MVERCDDYAALELYLTQQPTQPPVTQPTPTQVQVLDRDPSAAADHPGLAPLPPPTAVLEMDTAAELAACFRPAPRFAEDWDEAYGPTAVRVRGRLLDPVTCACGVWVVCVCV